MKNIRITIYPYRDASESVVMRLMMLAPVSPPTLSPRVLGHWYCDGFEGGFGRPLIEGKQGTYYVLGGIPPIRMDPQEFRWLSPTASIRGWYPPFATFFDPLGIGKTLPFIVLAKFDLFAARAAQARGDAQLVTFGSRRRYESQSRRSMTGGRRALDGSLPFQHSTRSAVSERVGPLRPLPRSPNY